MLEICDKNINNVRKCLKNNIINNNQFVGHNEERLQIFNLLKRTLESGESNSALLIGPRGSGKTTLVNDVIKDLKLNLKTDGVLVKLHGLIHTDDRSALKSATAQMKLENAVDGKVFGSFADNLAFLLACLKSGNKDNAKSVIFILEEFDLFCSHHNQTLLYNLFDISQSAQTPICVLGITCRLDVIELLEKRVKSRFSHRQYFLCPMEENGLSHLENRLNRIKQLLSIPSSGKKSEFPSTFKREWNAHIDHLVQNKTFKNMVQRLLDIDLSERTLKNILVLVVSKLNDQDNQITPESFGEEIKLLEKDDIVQILQDLSVLELCLIISMKHHCEIYDNQPMNFEMVFTRYIKFANSNSSVQTVHRPVIMKAFEHLENLELISMVSTGSSGILKEYQLFKLLVLPEQVSEAVKKSHGLPTEVIQWANSSLI